MEDDLTIASTFSYLAQDRGIIFHFYLDKSILSSSPESQDVNTECVYSQDLKQRGTVLTWRCNLTALSQRFNFYVVACEDELHFYQPFFPNHSLGSSPDLILILPKTNQNFRGHFWNRNPHSVNHLLIESLGEHEILLLACDDGDVMAFFTLNIQQAIIMEICDLNKIPISPFFLVNVQKSAWGLAVHTNARLVAVGSNSHEVTVFSFSYGDNFSNGDSIYNWPAYVKAEIKFRVTEPSSNIPTVAFCNTEDDPFGRWLVVGCIDGSCFWLDTITRRIHKKFHLFFCSRPHSHAESKCDCYQYPSFDHSVWGLLFLERYSFRVTDSRIWGDGIKIKHTQSRPNIPKSDFIDISRSIRRLPNWNSLFHFYMSPTDDTAIEFSYGLPDTDESSSDGNESESGNASQIQPFIEAVPLIECECLSTSVTGGKLSNENYLSNIPYYSHEVNNDPSDKLDTSIASPLAYFSLRDIFLLQPILASKLCKDLHNTAIVSMRRPLRQRVVEHSTNQAITLPRILRHPDRLCYYLHIPALGALLVGSPIGRVAVYSLIKTYINERKNVNDKNENSIEEKPKTNMQPRITSNGENFPEEIYGLRLVNIIPTPEQENRNERPYQLLAGIAASPIRSTDYSVLHMKSAKNEQNISQRVYNSSDYLSDWENLGFHRWRVIMTYKDQSILSYELWRKSNENFNLSMLAKKMYK